MWLADVLDVLDVRGGGGGGTEEWRVERVWVDMNVKKGEFVSMYFSDNVEWSSKKIIK